MFNNSNMFFIIIIMIVFIIIVSNKKEHFISPNLGPLKYNQTDNILSDLGMKNLSLFICPENMILYNGLCYYNLPPSNNNVNDNQVDNIPAKTFYKTK